MKKALTIFLFAIYATGATEAYQLLKLPMMVVHYVQHSTEDPDMSILKFVKMHYAETQVFDADWQQDMQLPFKSHEDNASLLQFSYFPPSFSEAITRPSLELAATKGGVLPVFNAGRYMPDIFQPPRS